MEPMLIYPVGSTPACNSAAQILESAGIPAIDHPSPEVTHLLLDIPSLAPDGSLRGGGSIAQTLAMLPQDITIIGGNLTHPVLDGYKTMDLLQDPGYLAENAAITADCALRVAGKELPVVFAGCPVLVIGWGRIGKCLGQLLKALGAQVTIAARRRTDRAALRSLGYAAVDTSCLQDVLPKFRLIFNTAPEMLLPKEALLFCRDCVKIDLASSPGMEGSGVIWARGLPGKLAPESSGRLIAKTIMNIVWEGML